MRHKDDLFSRVCVLQRDGYETAPFANTHTQTHTHTHTDDEERTGDEEEARALDLIWR